MHLIRFNFTWMTFNVFLALIPVLSGWLLYHTQNKYLRLLYGMMWLFFLPNSIYLLTDLYNLIWQWGRATEGIRLVFVIQYSVLVVLGVITYILALYPFELFLSRYKSIKKGKYTDKIIVLLNFVIGFGITLGRVERVNSWDLLFAFQNVVNSSINILFSFELLVLTIIFGLFANFLYFLFRKPIIKYFSTYLNRAGVLR